MNSFKLATILFLLVSESIFIQSAPHLQKWPFSDEHQSNACILICSECLKDDLNKMDSGAVISINLIFSLLSYFLI